MDVYMAAGNFPENRALVHRSFEKIFAGLQRMPVMPAAEKLEGHRISDHAIFVQNFRDAPA